MYLSGEEDGTRVQLNGLWYINQEYATLAVEEDVKEDTLLHHRRLGNPSFESLSKMYPELFSKLKKRELVCHACELGKHTRSTYSVVGLISCESFILMQYDVWGPCPVTSVNGTKWFVTFIYCYSRMTWIYMMKHKSEVLKYFQDFPGMVITQFNRKVHILRSDNGTEYVNNEFKAYLLEQGMLHPTTCPGTP